MPSTAVILAGIVLGLVCALGDASTLTAAEPGGDSLEDMFGGLVSNAGPGGTGKVIEVIETNEGDELQLASVMGRIGRAASEGPLRAPGGGLNSLLERLVMLSRRKTPPPRRKTPKTVVGGVLLPFVGLFLVAFFLARRFIPDATADLLGRAFASKPAVHGFALAEAVREAAVRHGVTLQGVTRVFVSLYFVHEGSAAFQVKFEQFHDSLIPIQTPFGPMRMVPPWEKGDAVDLVLLFTALCTMVRRVIPVEVGLVLLMVDAATDSLDLLGHLVIAYLTQGTAVVNELMAKKFSLLGSLTLVTLFRWRAARVQATRLLPPAHGEDGAAALLSSVPLLLGRLLIACIFLRVGYYELHRLVWSPEYVDIDPDDPHNVLWSKLLELALTVPFVLGFRTRIVSRLLVATLLLEAISVWQFWAVDSLSLRLHAREHFAVNVAVAGGLLLIQEVGGGRYTIDELMKKAA